MTRAEEQALKTYPRTDDAWCESNVDRRIGYKQGYNQAEQDIMEKAEKWWYKHLVGFLKEGLAEGVIAEFKQFMTEN